MNPFILSLLSVLLFAQATQARFGGVGGGDRQEGGHSGRPGQEGGHGGGRPFGGGPFGDRPGFPGGKIRPNITSLTCDAAFACEARRGKRRGESGQGTFACRQTYNPISGDVREKVLCIPNDLAWETDVCGCCGDDCPVQPNFVNITCPTETQPIADDYETRRQFNRKVFVCRDLYNPFTGEPTKVTVPIRPDHALEGDTCGCCDGVCPERGDKAFPRPDAIELDWCAADTITTCTLPKRKRQEDLSEGEDDRQGVFVCRSMANMLTGVAESQPVCIPSDNAWETDQCGCCGLDCPEKPERTGIECTEEADQCQMRNGKSGVFVCRSMFHPLDGSAIDSSLCIPDEKAWATDQCGCCGGTCPTSPEDGFEDEDVQLLSMALEVPESGIDPASGAFKAGSSLLAIGFMATTLFTF